MQLIDFIQHIKKLPENQDLQPTWINKGELLLENESCHGARKEDEIDIICLKFLDPSLSKLFNSFQS